MVQGPARSADARVARDGRSGRLIGPHRHVDRLATRQGVRRGRNDVVRTRTNLDEITTSCVGTCGRDDPPLRGLDLDRRRNRRRWTRLIGPFDRTRGSGRDAPRQRPCRGCGCGCGRARARARAARGQRQRHRGNERAHHGTDRSFTRRNGSSRRGSLPASTGGPRRDRRHRRARARHRTTRVQGATRRRVAR